MTIQYEKLRQILRFWELDDIADDQLKRFANQLQEALDEKNQPNLGLATTQQLIDELKARWDVVHVGMGIRLFDLYLIELEDLFRRDGSLDYRTVDG